MNLKKLLKEVFMSLLKKILTVSLIVTMLLAVFSLAISASNYEKVEQSFTLAQDIPEEDALPSEEELLTGYLEKDIYPDTSLFGRSAYDLLNEHEKILYTQIKTNLEKIAAGEMSSTAITVTANLDDFSWTTSELGVSTLVSGGRITSAAETAISNAIKSMISTGDIMRALLADLPYELFWFDKTEGMQTSYASSAQGSTASVTKFIFYFKVSSDYAASASYTTDITRISQISTAKQTAKAIVDKYANKTDIEKLTAYKNEICSLTNYYSGNIDTAAYGNPWQLVWVFDNDTSTDVVCEGYSKAFKYLCDLSDFSSSVYCYLVTGEMATANISGPHMWNIVEISGKNYLVDVTNSDDGSIGDRGTLFMVGATTLSNGAAYQIYGVATYAYDMNNLGNFLEDGVFIPVSQTSYAYDAKRIHTVTVNDGMGSGEYTEGVTVTITANEPGENQMFDRWVVSEGNITLSNMFNESATFIMPDQAVVITATYHTHTFAISVSYDDENHWYNYTCGCAKKHMLEPHQYEESITKAPSCDEYGVTTHTCECGRTYETPIEMIDHDYDDGTVTKEPSAFEVGEKKYTCSECGDFYFEEIEKLPESPSVEDKDPESNTNNGNVDEGNKNESTPSNPNENKPSPDNDKTESNNVGNSEQVTESTYADANEDLEKTYSESEVEIGCAASISTATLAFVCALGFAITKKRKD